MIFILEYFYWHFAEIPKRIIRLFSSLIWFGAYFFSVEYCLKTIFSPWKKTAWGYAKGLDIGKHLETLFSNLISRIIGFIMKIFIIIAWIFYEVLIILFGILVFLFWIGLPFLVVMGIIIALNMGNV